MAGRLLIYDGLGGRFRNVKVPPDPACRLCGPRPSSAIFQFIAPIQPVSCHLTGI